MRVKDERREEIRGNKTKSHEWRRDKMRLDERTGTEMR